MRFTGGLGQRYGRCIARVNPTPTVLWRQVDFLKLWAGQTISVFGSMIGGTALAFAAVLSLGAGPAEMGLLAVVRLLPGAVVGPIVGVWIDRLPRRPVLIAADIGRAFVLAIVPCAAVTGQLSLEVLYAVTFLASLLTVTFDVAYQTYLPNLVERAALVNANSKLSASAAAAEVSGFGLAGWLVQWFTAPLAILIDALSFVASAVSIMLIRTPEPSHPAAERRRVLHEVGEGLRWVLRDPLLRPLAACALTLHVGFGIVGTTILLFTSGELGFEPGLLGLIFAVGGLSSLAGAAVAERVTRRVGAGPAMIGGVTLMGVSIACLPLAGDASLAAALLLVAQQVIGDGAYTVYEIDQVSLRQAVAPERLLGRVNAALQTITLGATLAGSLLGGLLGVSIGLRPALATAAGIVILAALWLLLSPVRSVRKLGEGTVA